MDTLREEFSKVYAGSTEPVGMNTAMVFKGQQSGKRFGRIAAIWKIMLSCALLSAGLGAQTTPSGNDPVGGPGHLNLFPDDELVTITPDGAGGSNLVRSFVTDSSPSLPLNYVDYATTAFGTNSNPIVGAAGRVIQPDSDTAVWVSRDGATSNVKVNLLSSPTSGNYLTWGYAVGGNLADRNEAGLDVEAVAVGDLDRATDASGNYHDEIAVAYQSSNSQGSLQLQLVVMNFTGGTSDVKWTPTTITVPDSPATPADNPLSIAIGDFDGDGNNEIAVGYTGAAGIHIATFKYAGGVLQFETWTNLTELSGFPQQSLALQADDFRGDGGCELAVAYVVNHAEFPEKEAFPTISFVTFSSTLQGTVSAPSRISAGSNVTTITSRVRLATGQFLYGPNIPFGQHQLAVAFNSNGTILNPTPPSTLVGVFTAASDLNSIGLVGAPVAFGPTPYSFSLVGGGFAGRSNINSPTASLAFSMWQNGGNGSSYFTVYTIAVTSNGPSIQNHFQTTAPSPNVVPLVAADLSGKSLYLGAPIVITADNLIRPQYMIQQPPSHAYWCKSSNCDNGAGTTVPGPAVVNVSRSSSTNSFFSQNSKSGTTNQTTTTSDDTIGGSASVSATATVKGGANLGIVDLSGSASTSLTAGLSYQNQKNSSNYASNASSFDLGITAKTTSDDWLQYNQEAFTIWRYRIYGVAQQNSLNSFYEVVLPGQGVETYGNGQSADWYQPIHEVGNILSYPQFFGPNDSLTPWDVGPVTPDGFSSPITTPLVSAEELYVGNGDTSSTLRYSSSVANSTKYATSNTLGENADLKTSFSATVGGDGVSVTGGVSANLSFNNKNSWSSATVGTNTLTTDTAMAINIVGTNSSATYGIYPVVYSALDGTMKLSFAVPNPGQQGSGSAQFWTDLYGPLPDPALNLPHRFDVSGSSPQPVTDYLRKQMQGLFFRRSSLNPASDDYDYLNNNVTEGETVRLEARIYNYSTGTQTSPIKVNFQAIPVDENNNEVCTSHAINGDPSDSHPAGLVCPAGDRKPIGDMTIPVLAPLQFTCLAGTDAPEPNSNTPPNVTNCSTDYAFVNWNTQGFGGGSAGTSKNYRVYVVLNPGVVGLENTSENYTSEGPPVAISSITNGKPVKVETTNPHGLQTGYYVTIGGVNGVPYLDSTFEVTVTSPTTFTLNNTVAVPVPTTCTLSPYTCGGTVSLLDPGQNNEGYGVDELTITTPSSGLGSGGPGTKHRPADDYLKANSVEAVDRRTKKLVAGSVTAYQGKPLHIRVKVYSSESHPIGTRLVVYNGNPKTGGRVIADRLVHPGTMGTKGESVWLTWTPEQAGAYELYAELHEQADDTQKHNNVATFKVNVLAAGDVNGDGQINNADLKIMMQNLDQWVQESACGPACDLDGDNLITVLDVRKLILLCGPKACSAP